MLSKISHKKSYDRINFSRAQQIKHRRSVSIKRQCVLVIQTGAHRHIFTRGLVYCAHTKTAAIRNGKHTRKKEEKKTGGKSWERKKRGSACAKVYMGAISILRHYHLATAAAAGGRCALVSRLHCRHVHGGHSRARHRTSTVTLLQLPWRAHATFRGTSLLPGFLFVCVCCGGGTKGLNFFRGIIRDDFGIFLRWWQENWRFFIAVSNFQWKSCQVMIK